MLAENSMRFEWGHSIPKQMTCSNCGAKWELFFGLNETWRLLSAKLVDNGSTEKGTNLLGKMYETEFWRNTVVSGISEKPRTLETKKAGEGAEKIVIIREIVKIRCPYCGALYDEVKNMCPHCGGKR